MIPTPLLAGDIFVAANGLTGAGSGLVLKYLIHSFYV